MATENEGIREWTRRIRAEFLEMPGLALTRRQVKRLWILDAPLCDAVLDRLLESGFLRRRRDDTVLPRRPRPLTHQAAPHLNS